MKKKTLKLKGLKTPKLFLFIHGFTNGRMKTAAVDSESGNLNSAYIHGKVYLFDKLCHDRVIQLDCGLSELRTEAQTLILELNELVIPPLYCANDLAMHGTGDANAPNTVAAAQAGRAAAASAEKAARAATQRKQERENILTRRAWIIRRLVAIREKLALEERICSEELAATADALRNCFCIYGHGALLKPINHTYIPPVDYQCYLDGFRADYLVLKTKITNVLEKEAD